MDQKLKEKFKEQTYDKTMAIVQDMGLKDKKKSKISKMSDIFVTKDNSKLPPVSYQKAKNNRNLLDKKINKNEKNF